MEVTEFVPVKVTCALVPIASNSETPAMNSIFNAEACFASKSHAS